jgi:hypothetical protein
VLDLRRTAAEEDILVAIGGKAKRIPEADWRLNTELALESAERRRGV